MYRNKFMLSVSETLKSPVPADNSFNVLEVSQTSQSVLLGEEHGRLPIIKVSIELFSLVFEEV